MVNSPSLAKVIIADNHRLFADGLNALIAEMPAFEVLAVVSNGNDLLQMLDKFKPTLVLLDITMPILNGFEAALAIRDKQPGLKIVFISQNYTLPVRTFIEQNNIEGFILKDVSAPRFKEGLRKVMEGKKVCILPDGVRSFSTPEDEAYLETDLQKLTKTENEIVRLLCNGYSSKMIADQRGLSLLTVETHRKNIFRKLSVKNAAELVAFALKKGILK